VTGAEQVQAQEIQSALTLIRDAVRNGNNVQILFYTSEYLCSTNRYLAIYGKTRTFVARNLTISTLLSKDPDTHFKAVPIRDDSGLMALSTTSARPIEELFWQLAYRMSASGILLPGCDSHDVVYLLQWPNFTRINHSPAMLRMAALFSARPTPLDVAAKVLDVPRAEVNCFYSAARYAGYADKLSRSNTVNVKNVVEDQERSGIVRALMQKLRKSQ